MKIKKYTENTNKYTTRTTICLNRGIPLENIKQYLSNSYEDINSPEAFGEELLKKGVSLVIKTINDNKKAWICVDSDCDGLTSSALLINYLYAIFPAWTENNLSWSLHSGKQHGLSDHIDMLLKSDYDLIICPDSATNDTDFIDSLYNLGKEVLILDHHLSDVPMSKDAVIINSQYNYPNPQLSGAGVVWQFCRYMDKLLNIDKAKDFVDLAAIGDMGDMMDIRCLETKELIFLGMIDANIKNPLIYGLSQKNAFALSKADYTPSADNNLAITPMGSAFFIIPLLNAICRSGTIEEKNLIFNSMLTMEAFKKIPSNKRGHKEGDMEEVVEQALRTCTNVKNRQTRNETAGIELLTEKAEQMLDNKVLVFALEPGEIDSNISGLVANELASKYQRPTYILFNRGDEISGSGRGYTMTGIENMKAISESSDACNWCRGHENAHGCSLNNVDKFVADMNEKLKDISTDIVYYVDYAWDASEVDGEAITEMADMNDYLGTRFARPQIEIHNFLLEPENVKVMKSNTLKFTLPNQIDIIKFGGTDEEIELLTSNKHKIQMICKCNINEWNGMRNPQLICLDYEITDTIEQNVLEMWGF